MSSSARAPVSAPVTAWYMAASKALRTSGRSNAINLTPASSSMSIRCSLTVEPAHSRSDHLSPVNIEDVAGDPRRLIGEQEQAHAHQVGGLTMTFEGERRQDRLHEGIRYHGAGRLSVDRPGGDGVGPDVLATELVGQ